MPRITPFSAPALGSAGQGAGAVPNRNRAAGMDFGDNVNGNGSQAKTINLLDPANSNPDCAEGVHIPSGFSPNGIGPEDNNSFQIITGQNVDGFQFQIFNRWGKIMFESSSKGFQWDGKYKGVDCSSINFVEVVGNDAPPDVDVGASMALLLFRAVIESSI